MKYPTPWKFNSAYHSTFDEDNIVEIDWSRNTEKNSYERKTIKVKIKYPDEITMVNANPLIRIVVNFLSIFLK